MARRFLAALLVLLISACSQAPAAQTDDPAPTATPPPTSEAAAPATTAPTQPSADEPPTQAAATPAPGAEAAGAVVYNVQADGSIWSMDFGGGSFLLVDPTSPEQNLPWSASPDGRTIATVAYTAPDVKSGRLTYAQLWTVRTDGSEPVLWSDLIPAEGSEDFDTRVTLTNPTFQQLIWTATGELVFTSAHEGQVDLYALELASGAVRRLTDSPEYEHHVTLSPDGRSIAYVSVSTFGTGAGWGDPSAWMQPLDGAPTLLADKDMLELTSSLEVLGWRDNTSPVILASSVAGQGALYVGGGIDTLETLYAGELLIGAVAGGTIAAADAPDGALRIWWPGQSEPEISVEANVRMLEIAPDGAAVYACANEPSGRWIVLPGRTIDVGGGPCMGAVWGPDTLVALGGDPINGDPALVILPDAGVIGTLPGETLLAGWQGPTLYYVVPNGAGTAAIESLDTTTNQTLRLGEVPHLPLWPEVVAP